jgi:hypothetical protein
MATTEEIRTDLADIVNEVAGVDADDVQLDKSFVDDLDVDSLSMVEVVDEGLVELDVVGGDAGDLVDDLGEVSANFLGGCHAGELLLRWVLSDVLIWSCVRTRGARMF